MEKLDGHRREDPLYNTCVSISCERVRLKKTHEWEVHKLDKYNGYWKKYKNSLVFLNTNICILGAENVTSYLLYFD